jgi:hypothetical protein
MAEALRRFRAWWIADDVPYGVFATYIGALPLLSFWPFLAGYNQVQRLEQSAMVVGLVSVDNMLASAVAIALVTPLWIDVLVDCATRCASKTPYELDSSISILNFVERLIVYAGLVIMPVCSFVHSSNLGLLALCCSRFQFAAVYGGWVLCASRLLPTWFPAKLCMLSMGNYIVSLNVKAYLSIAGLVANDSITKCSVVLRYAALVILVVMSTNWLLNHLLLPYCRQRKASTLPSLPTESVVDEESTLDQRFARHKWTTAMKQTVLSRKTAFVAILLAVCGTTVGLTMSVLDRNLYSELMTKELVQVSPFVFFLFIAVFVNFGHPSFPSLGCRSTSRSAPSHWCTSSSTCASRAPTHSFAWYGTFVYDWFCFPCHLSHHLVSVMSLFIFYSTR